MTETVPLQIRNDRLSLRVLPRLGGGIAAFDWVGRGAGVPLMRPWTPGGDDDPNHLAC
jgi:aldose 1-epimerase